METLFVIVFAFLLAITAFALALEQRRVARQVAAWHRVQGRLVSREVVPSAVGSTSAPGRRFTPAVRYTYVVDGREYTGDRLLARGTISGMRENVLRVVDALGDPVEVRYNPANPAEACLQAPPGWWVPGLFAAAAFAGFIAFATLVTSFGSGR